MTSHKRTRNLFSVDDIREEVSNEISFDQLFKAFVAFEDCKAAHANLRALEAWLVGKYGLATALKCLSFTKSARCLPCGDQKRLFMKLFPNVDANHINLFEVLNSTSEAVWEIYEGRCILAPPTSKCLICSSSLSAHHKCIVVVYGFSGAKEATKISTRCQSCSYIYNYSNYGNGRDGWKLYSVARDCVEASDLSFVERPMYELQCSLANHCWVSFSGWSVAYNESLGQGSTSLVFSDKNAAAVFWNGEIETELRVAGQLDYYGLFHKNEDREIVMEEIERRRAESVYGHSPQDCSDDCKKRGNASAITSSKAEANNILGDCIETQPTSCNKDTGEKKRLQKWSRGHFFIVRGSGIIDKWNPLFRSESPSQAFLFLIEWMLVTFRDIPECQWGDIFVSYDNMCHVDGMKVAQKALPFPPPYDQMWIKVNKIIDSLHFANHKSQDCKEKYNPEKVKEKLPDANTMAGEQTFTWLSRFKRTLCAMPKVHHMFFMHRMVVRRNEYTVSCYKNGKKPVLPKARH